MLKEKNDYYFTCEYIEYISSKVLLTKHVLVFILFFAASCLVGAGCGGLNSVRRIGKTA